MFQAKCLPDLHYLARVDRVGAADDLHGLGAGFPRLGLLLHRSCCSINHNGKLGYR